MTETPENGRQQGVGKTGGLPGHHADPATRQPTADQLAEVRPVDEAPAPDPNATADTDDTDGAPRDA